MYATELQLDSISALTETAIRNTRQAAAQSNKVIKAFNKTIAPVLIDSAKGFSRHWFESECYWRERITKFAGITHNPLTAAIRAARAELISEEAIATYRHIRNITRETAMDALVIGLCGVVAVAQGVEAAQKVYRLAKRFYHWVDGRLNPPLEQPTLLPTVDLCLSQLSDAELAARIESLTDKAIASHPEPAPLQPAQVEDCPTEVEPVAFWNPAPTDMHEEVQQRLEAIARAEEAEDRAITPDATAAPAMAEDMLVSALEVPGATVKPKRQRKARASGEAKPKQTRDKAVVK